MEKINNELLEKAKQAKNVEELVALAKQNGVEMTEEQAKAYYAQLHPTFGEIDDDELDNVAGGGCGGGNEGERINHGDRVYCPTACPKCGNHYGYYNVINPRTGASFIGCESCSQSIWYGVGVPDGTKKA